MRVKPGVVHLWAMTEETPYFRLRVPEELKAKVRDSAQINKRSMTAEIISRLEASFAIESQPTKYHHATEERLREIITEIVEEKFHKPG